MNIYRLQLYPKVTTAEYQGETLSKESANLISVYTKAC